MNQQTSISSATHTEAVPLGPAASSARPEQPAAPESQVASTLPQSHKNGKTTKSSLRCSHLFQSGRRCRQLASATNPGFCPRHARLPENLQPDDLTPELTANPADLDTFEGMHFFLEHLAILLAKNRISTRRAAVLAYITNQLLRTLSAFRKEEAQAEESTQIILDAPRPIRD